MLIDSLLLFSDAQAVTSAAGSTNTIDLSVTGGRDIGTGEPLYIVMTVDVGIDAGKTVTVALEGDSTTTFSPDATDTVFVTGTAGETAGAVYIARLDPGMAALQYRYIRLKYTPSSALTNGTFTAFITHDIQKWKAYADNITIQS